MKKVKISKFNQIMFSGAIASFVFLFCNYRLVYTALDLMLLFGGFLCLLLIPMAIAFQKTSKKSEGVGRA